jgi:hypothetical protein
MQGSLALLVLSIPASEQPLPLLRPLPRSTDVSTSYSTLEVWGTYPNNNDTLEWNQIKCQIPLIWGISSVD